jgi:hypothetical protein
MAKEKRQTGKWKVLALKKAREDAKDFLNDTQYAHVVELVRRLKDWQDRKQLTDLRIQKIRNDLWELKDKGGVLGKINVRVFFAPLSERKEIIVLGAFKKEMEDQTPGHMIVKMERRLSDYLEDQEGKKP